MIKWICFIFSKIQKKSRLPSVRHSRVHKTSKIEAGSSFVYSSMDKNSFCGYDCEILQAEIGRYTSIASNVTLGGARHPMERVSMSPAFYAGRDSIKTKFAEFDLPPPTKIIIGHDVWIGKSAIVLPGVTIGNGAVVGAGSVVTKDVPPYAIVAGNPARLIRFRFSEGVIEKLQASQWWQWPDSKVKKLAPYFDKVEAFLEESEKLGRE